jgi:hypothetical protein
MTATTIQSALGAMDLGALIRGGLSARTPREPERDELLIGLQ